MSNTLTIKGYTFNDRKIANGNLTLFSSVISDSLEVDECVFTLVKADGARFITRDSKKFTTANSKVFYVRDGFDFGALKYGDKMTYEHTEGTRTKEYTFFVSSVSRISRNAYQVVGQSTIGMLASQTFKGGVYEGDTTVGEVIDEIFGDFEFSYGANFDIYQKIYGWLPYSDSRSALQQILFALGAVVVDSGAGWPEIRYPEHSAFTEIPDSLVSLGGSIELGDKVSRVEITEYTYFRAESFEIVFDNTEDGETADHALILLDKPAYEFTASSEELEILDSGANYAIISGRGRLTATYYGYTQKIFAKTVDANTPEKVAKVDSCYLVSPANSYNVLERLAGYYSENVTVKNDIARDLEAGMAIQFTDPFGNTQQGIAQSLSIPVSGVAKASTVTKCGWTPSNFGNNFTAERRIFCGNANGGSTSVTWTKPEGVKLLYIALISGGEGGAKGADGAAGGTNGATTGGEGGAAGQDGYGGKFNIFRLEVPEAAATIQFSAGAGGNPNGGEGGESTMTIGSAVYSSEDGTESPTGEGWADIFTGDRYAMDGENLAQNKGLKKYAGAKGGDEGYQTGKPGGNVSTFTGGAGGNHATRETSTKYYWGEGGSGGGAAYGANGGDGADGTVTSHEDGVFGGNGGDGADGAAGFNAYTYGYGHGGGGGNGGGGGGCGGLAFINDTAQPAKQGAGGQGGQGGQGGHGAGGCCIVYY